jgi:hypothetical protein
MAMKKKTRVTDRAEIVLSLLTTAAKIDQTLLG